MAVSWNHEFRIAVELGQVPGYSRIVALGNNPDVDTLAHEDVWPGGGIYPWPAGNVALEVLSDSADDTASGTGARSILLGGLIAGHEATPNQTVALNGVTPVPIPTSLFRINSLRVASAGSGERNAGTITVRVAGGGATLAVIPPLFGISRQAVYSVPAGFTLLVDSLVIGINRSTGVGRFATFATMFRAGGVSRLPLELSVGDEQPYLHMGRLAIPIAEKTDFTLRCTSVSADTTDVTASFEAILKDNLVN